MDPLQLGLLARISHQAALRMMKKSVCWSIYEIVSECSPGHPALGARSLVRNAG